MMPPSVLLEQRGLFFRAWIHESVGGVLCSPEISALKSFLNENKKNQDSSMRNKVAMYRIR